MSERIVIVEKDGPDMKLGVRLSGTKGNKVKIVEINPAGPLAGKVEKNEYLLAINGVPCSEGHQKAAEDLRAAYPSLELTVGARRASMISRAGSSLISASHAPATKRPAPTQLSRAQSSFTEVDTGAVNTGLILPSVPVAAPEPAAPVSAPAAVAEVVAEAPKAAAPVPAAATLKPATGLAPDEYSVILQRNKTASIGMRLVQKKHTELPYIADIDPDGPAAKTDIRVWDVLLEVNGVDARADHDKLKAALGTTDAAVLKLRRSTPKGMAAPPAPSGTAQAAEKPALGGIGGWSPFGCCAMARAQMAAA